MNPLSIVVLKQWTTVKYLAILQDNFSWKKLLQVNPREQYMSCIQNYNSGWLGGMLGFHSSILLIDCLDIFKTISHSNIYYKNYD